MRSLSMRAPALVLTALLLWPGVGAAKEARIALVIGNGEYTTESLPSLANPPNDARLMAKTLRSVGFEVLERLDQDQNGIRRSIRDFGEALDKAGEDAVGLFFYAGHGVQVGGRNYMLPVDADIRRESDVGIEAVDANTVLQTLDFARTRLNFVIIDACRNNPLSRGFRSASRGLARMDAPRGTLIGYATAPGDVAADGTGANSPYTKALAESMRQPGLTVEQMFRRVRNTVMANTKDQQVPWESSSLTGGDFYFNPEAPPPPPPTAAVAPPPPPPSVDREAMFWQSVKDSKNPAAYEAYLEKYPDGEFSLLARLKLEELSRPEVAQVTPPRSAAEVEEMYATFVTLRTVNLRSGPSTSEKAAGRLKRGAGVTVTGKVKGKNWYRVEKEDGSPAFVPGTLLEQVNAAELAHWERIRDSRDAEDFKIFLERFPGGYFAVQAKRMTGSSRPQQTAAVVAPTRPSGVRTFYIQPVSYKGRNLRFAADIIHRGLMGIADSKVVRQGRVAPDDTIVTTAITLINANRVDNPEYAGAQMASQIFGGFMKNITSKIPKFFTNIDSEVLISAKDGKSGLTTTETGRGRVRQGDHGGDRNAAVRKALELAFSDGAKRLVIRLAGGVPPPWQPLDVVQQKKKKKKKKW